MREQVVHPVRAAYPRRAGSPADCVGVASAPLSQRHRMGTLRRHTRPSPAAATHRSEGGQTRETLYRLAGGPHAGNALGVAGRNTSRAPSRAHPLDTAAAERMISTLEVVMGLND